MLSICSSPKLRSHSWYLIFFTSSPSAVILVSSTFRTYPDFSLYLHHPAPGHHYLFPWCMKKDSCLTASLLPLMESILNLTARSLTAVRSCHLFVQNSLKKYSFSRSVTKMWNTEDFRIHKNIALIDIDFHSQQLVDSVLFWSWIKWRRNYWVLVCMWHLFNAG